MQAKSELTAPLRGHIPALDGVRGFAVATVFIYHYGGGAQSGNPVIRLIGTTIHFGWAGVSLFFVLSGFLISGILWDGFKKPDWWKRFYARRSLRIFPLYYLAILIAFITGLFIAVPGTSLAPLWIYVLYLGDIPALGHLIAQLPQSLPLSHFWSLAVEEQFYLIWPFLLVLFAGKRSAAKRLIAALCILSLAYRILLFALHVHFDWQWEFLFGRAGELLAGAWLALSMRGDAAERESLFRWLPTVLITSFAALVGIIIASHGPEFESPVMSTFGLTVCSLFFTSIVASCLRPGFIQNIFEFPFLRWLGKISYGIYVYHLLLRNGFIWITDHLIPNAERNTRLGVIFCVALVGTLAVASLSFYTFESAFLRIKDRVAH